MKIIQKNWLSRVGIVVIAAIMVAVISIVQYRSVRDIMEEEMEVRSRVVQRSISAEIGHMLELTEATMRENLWEVKRSLHNPDSVFSAMVYLIDDNPHVAGGCLSFVPDYYPSKGRLFEPYAYKKDGSIHVEQIAGPHHDYTQNPFFQFVADSGKPDWSDPYLYGPDSLSFTTFSYPVYDDKNRLAAVCGLDMDLSWLGDTLNARQPFHSSYILLLTQHFNLVAGPPENRASKEQVISIVNLLREGKLRTPDNTISVRLSQMNRDPFWQVALVYQTNDLFGRMNRVSRQQLILVLLGLVILFFMIDRFARNERKLRETASAKARMEGELSIARNIQREMLPKSFEEGIYGKLEPAMEVGGDLYDFYTRDGKLFFCIGDVSGKGVPSAMLMSVIHSLFRMVSHKTESPTVILKALNEQLCQGNDSGMFVTFFVGCLDLYTGKLHFSNAGHDKPFVLTSSAALLDAKPHLPLGVFPDTEYTDQSCVLAPGTSLFLYTDGLTEAKNASRENFGRSRVQEVLESFARHPGYDPRSVVESLSDAAHRFAGNAPQSDDLTMLLIKYAPGDMIREQITLSNDKEEVSLLNDFIKAFFARLDVDHRLASGIRLAVEESAVNAMSYAYPAGERGEVSVYADSNHREVRFTIVDAGAPFDPTAVLSADTTLDAQNRPIGGLGIHLTRKLMDSVSYCRKEDKNVLTLTKSII